MTTIQKIQLALIDRSPTQPRTDFGDIEALATMLRASGQAKPVDVRKKDGRYELVDGERRWRAAQLLEWTELDAIVMTVTDVDVEVRHIASSDGKPLTPLEEATVYARLQDVHGLVVADISDRVGRSVAHVQSRLRLAQMHPSVQALFAANRIRFASVARLSHLSLDFQEEAADVIVRTYPVGKVSTLDVVHVIERRTHRLAAAPFDTASETLTTAGPCTGCNSNTSTQRDFFEESDDEATCLRTECFADKVSANEAIERADAERAQIRIMDESEVALVLDAGRLRPGASWVQVDAPIDDESEVTWRELEVQLAEADKEGEGYAPAKLAMAFDHGHSILLMESIYAEGFIRNTHPRRAAQLRGEPDPDVQAAKDLKKAEREKDAAQAEIDAECVQRVVEGVRKKFKPKTQRHTVMLCMDVVGQAAVKSVCDRRDLALEETDGRKISARDALDRSTLDMDEAELSLLMLDLILTRHLDDPTLPAKALGSLLDLYGVDPKEVKKELAREKRNVRTRKKAKGAESAEAAS